MQKIADTLLPTPTHQKLKRLFSIILFDKRDPQQMQPGNHTFQITPRERLLAKRLCSKATSSKSLGCVSEPSLFVSLQKRGEGADAQISSSLILRKTLGFPPVLCTNLTWYENPGIEIIDGRWKLRKQIGAGGFGIVYEATDMHNGNVVAVKVELSVSKNTLKIENDVYDRLSETSSKFVGFPARLFYGEMSTYKRFLVLQKLGASLRSVLAAAAGGRLPPKIVFALGIQGLKRLQDLHGIGFVHGDVRLENLLMGAEDTMRLYLIDFGIAKRCLDDEDSHAQESRHRGLRETMGAQSTYPDSDVLGSKKGYDLQSLGYCLVELSTGRLPWTEGNGSRLYSGETEVAGILKIGTNPSMRVEKELSQYFEYVRALKFNEMPDYPYLMSLFRKGIARH